MSRKMQRWLSSQTPPKLPPPSRYARDLLLASDPKTPGSVLASLLEVPLGERTEAEATAISIQVAQNPNTPKESLARLSYSEPVAAASNPALKLLALEDPGWCQANLARGVAHQLFADAAEKKRWEEIERRHWEQTEERTPYEERPDWLTGDEPFEEKEPHPLDDLLVEKKGSPFEDDDGEDIPF